MTGAKMTLVNYYSEQKIENYLTDNLGSYLIVKNL